MPGPNTRSLYSSTYVYKEPRLSSAKKTSANCSNNIYQKAQVIVKLVKYRSCVPAFAQQYKEKIINNKTAGLTASQKTAHSRLLKAIGDYAGNNSYGDILDAAKTLGDDTLVEFSRYWIAGYGDFLTKALDDWQALAKAEMTDINAAQAKDAAKAVAAAKDSVAALKASVTALQKKSNAKTAEGDQNPREIIEPVPDTAAAENIKALPKAGLGDISKSCVLSKMWQSEKSRSGAKLLGAILFGDEAAGRYAAALSDMEPSANTALAQDVFAAAVRDEVGKYHKELLGALEQIRIDPVGHLFLERLDFTPVGYVRGELVYSLPLTPGEKTTVSHKEWSNTSEEYIKEVSETIEDISEEEVSEETELTKAASAQEQTGWKVGAAVSVGYSGGGFNINASSDFSITNNKSTAVNSSTRKNQAVTSTAASRSKTDHKITFKVAKETSVSDEQVRVIENNSSECVRWDFYRLMKKWKIELFHIGERLTYDIVVPEPGDYLLRKYIELNALQAVIDAGDPFERVLKEFTDLRGGNSDFDYNDFCALAQRLGVANDIDAVPQKLSLTFEDEADIQMEQERSAPQWEYRKVKLEFPEGYTINIGNITSDTHPEQIDYCYSTDDGTKVRTKPFWTKNRNDIARYGYPNVFSWSWFYFIAADFKGMVPKMSLTVEARPSAKLIAAWRQNCLAKLREAARMKWLTVADALQNKVSRLALELTGRDALKLRQMEREEMAKGVLRWLLGPDFDFYPADMMAQFIDPGSGAVPKLDYYDAQSQSVKAGTLQRKLIVEYGEAIRFIQQAIEWENMNWVLYPYFWTMPGRWDFKQGLEHPDFFHRAFLRAGCARVVIPIRQGFEQAWLEFVEKETLSAAHPYITLAKELESQARANYSYTPDPNRQELTTVGQRVDTWFEYTPTGALHIEPGPVPVEY